MFHHVRRFTPVPQVPSDALVTYELTHRFYQEKDYRDACDRHHQWYAATAAKHREELQRMRGDFNLLGLFRRGA